MPKKSGIDLVLVNPGNPTQVYQSLGKELAALEPPVWAGLMASYGERKGLSVQILDANAEGLSLSEVADRVATMNPVLVAVVVYGHQPSASTQNMPACSAVCRELKQRYPQFKIILVGGHAAALSERTLAEEDADYVCSGEGPETLYQLVLALKSGKNPDFSKVGGLYYYDEQKKIGSTAPYGLIQNLDEEMPGVPWDLLPMARYRAHNWHCFGHLQRQPYVALYTTLGCPYHCSFCCIQAPFKEGERALGLKQEVNSYRFWSPDTVISQIEILVKNYGVKNIKFADEMFVLNPKHVEGICDLIIERGYDLNIWAYARVDTVRDGMIDKLKRAGFNWLAFGIESGSKRVRRDVQKGFDQDLIFRTIEKVRSAGIYVIGNYIFGLPDDDHESMQETLDLAIELNCEFANFYCSMAYPGSPLYNQALGEGWSLPKAWSGYSQHSIDMLPLPTRHLSASEVIRFRDQAFQTYFSNPRYLEMVRTKFGVDTENHVREMSAHKLVRANA